MVKNILIQSLNLSSLFPHFDQDKVIDNMMSGKNWSKSPYFGMTKEEIKDSEEKWSGSIFYGNLSSPVN